MSFDVALEYLNKAKEYLNASRLLFSNSSYNVSSLASGVSAQLAIKTHLGIEVPRTREIRKLLSIIIEDR
ncbi:HEPN domain-containing protein [Acidianus infernus]|uniref:HEPN domain-containing protein n=1 Tax=Acidianus infernus TaxID=12915 RepID=UPI001F0D2A60|nr:HEPN domain-containing protein [Acidianus infernus]